MGGVISQIVKEREETKRKKEEEETKRLAKDREEETKRKKEEEETKRKKEEEETKRLAKDREEETKRLLSGALRKRGFPSTSTAESSTVGLLTGDDAKRLKALQDLSGPLDVEKESYSEAEVAVLGKLFTSMAGVPPSDVELLELIHESSFHVSTPAGSQVSQPANLTMPANDAAEETVVKFLLYVLALAIGKKKPLFVHDVQHKQLFSSSNKRPDIVIASTPSLPVLGQTSNLVVECKTYGNFDKPDHNMQAGKYASLLCMGLHYQTSYVILACQNRVKFMVYERASDTLKASDVFELGMTADGQPAPGLLALRGFIRQAKLESLPTPNLSPFNGSADFPIPSECRLLKAKSNSIVFELTTSEVLKKLATPEAFNREFAALREIPQHESLIKGVAYDRDNMFLVTRPLGVCDLASNKVCEGMLPPDLKTMWLGLLDGLKALHTAGWVHRDIRPENIVKTGNGRFVLIDVGLAAQEPSLGKEFVGCVSFAADLHLELLEKKGDTYSFTRGSDLESFLKTLWYSSCASVMLQNVVRDKAAPLAPRGRNTVEAIRGLREFWNQRGIPALGTAYNSYEAALDVTVDFISKNFSSYS